MCDLYSFQFSVTSRVYKSSPLSFCFRACLFQMFFVCLFQMFFVCLFQMFFVCLFQVFFVCSRRITGLYGVCCFVDSSQIFVTSNWNGVPHFHGLAVNFMKLF